MNERFTRIADSVSEALGKWWFTALSLLALVLWISYGVVIIGQGWFQSTAWGLPFNAVTSGGEWFFEGLIAAAANRVEKRNREFLERIDNLEAQNHMLLERIDQLLERKAS